MLKNYFKILTLTFMIILIFASTVVFIFGLMYYFNGSLESFPTEEQISKVKTASTIIMIFSFGLDFLFVFLLRKLIKNMVNGEIKQVNE